ncbi:PLP-dependent transferase [Sistotremastrum niveocremeum HHB9708]|uniref:PLP-dependent transferase n=2 Tax=Sistotremastraceae TaxID=3402574 RepID=A0A164TP87_9AGAM|nr:PLP-dependent transferase [Sistotremastrum niveocremeum HHB9708]KZT42190.1 PLP-dependent transferase [Sistotremastrum suecicum HHB10207 ss-3]
MPVLDLQLPPVRFEKRSNEFKYLPSPPETPVLVNSSLTDSSPSHEEPELLILEQEELNEPPLEVLPDDFYDQFLSQSAKRRKASQLRFLLPLEKTPGVISLLAGKPNPTTFPITSLSFTTRSPFDPSVSSTIKLEGKALNEGLQYNLTSGLPDLVSWITELQERSHERKAEEGWRVSMGVGSQDVISKCVSALLDDGDSVFIETPAYPGIVPLFQSMNINIIEIPTDSKGIIPEAMSEILDSWEPEKPKPKFLYTIPVGSNPTGVTASGKRRLEVLALARKHNFLILEDDPYYYLYYGKAPRPPSYFTLESWDRSSPAGRVIRFDSLSKILSSGFRLGFVTGPLKILKAIDMQTALSNLQASSFAQAVCLAILQSWGYEGFYAHTLRVATFYKERRDMFVSSMERYLPGLAQWNVPEAGMFIWLNLLVPPAPNCDEPDSEQLIRTKAFAAGVLAVPGLYAFPLGRINSFVRVSFSLLEQDDMDEACRRLANVIREAQDDLF